MRVLLMCGTMFLLMYVLIDMLFEKLRAAGIIKERKSKPVQMSIDVWHDVLKCITRKKMANDVSLVCQGLNRLCWPRLHGNRVIPRPIHMLTFDERTGENGQTETILHIQRKEYGRREVIPIATVAPVPDYIQVRKIDINCLNPEVLEFVQSSHLPLVNLKFLSERFFMSDLAGHQLRTLLNALNGCTIQRVDISSTPISIFELRLNFTGLLENVPAICMDVRRIEDWIEMDELVLAKHARREPFFLQINGKFCPEVVPLVAKISRLFRIAVHPQSFLINFSFGRKFSRKQLLNEFRLENGTTREVLKLENMGDSHYRLYRCPREEEHQWLEDAYGKFACEEGTTFYL